MAKRTRRTGVEVIPGDKSSTLRTVSLSPATTGKMRCRPSVREASPAALVSGMCPVRHALPRIVHLIDHVEAAHLTVMARSARGRGGRQRPHMSMTANGGEGGPQSTKKASQ